MLVLLTCSSQNLRLIENKTYVPELGPSPTPYPGFGHCKF